MGATASVRPRIPRLSKASSLPVLCPFHVRSWLLTAISTVLVLRRSIHWSHVAPKMGTITPRKRSNGTTGYTAQIRIKRDGRLVYTEAQTFDRRPAASAWLAKREAELAEPGGLERVKAASAPILADVIDRYIGESRRKIGRTKAQVLAAIKALDIGRMRCADIRSEHIVAMARKLSDGRTPQTVANYISHLAAIFAIARPAWNVPLDAQAMKDAHVVLRRMGLTAKSKKRERRPTLDELDKLMQHFADRSKRRPSSLPMHRVIGFAIFSTRRQEEITTLATADFDPAGKRALIRDMKHPGDKIGNDTWCDMPDQATAIASAMPQDGDRLFPYSTDAISAAFTRACQLLDIEDLHFHDLRHDGISRLFEMGKTVPQAASVSGHRSWQSLQRYTHLRQTGDKYAGWTWLPMITAPMAPRRAR